jgi:hypothetical protein
MNGDIATAIFSKPRPIHFPFIMEIINEQKQAMNASLGGDGLFDMRLAQGAPLKFPRNPSLDRTIGVILANAYNFWSSGDDYKEHFNATTGNPVIDALNALLGTSSIFSMRHNKTVHPLAQLSALGKSMMYASLRNFLVGDIMDFGGKALFGPQNLISVFGSFLATIGIVTLGMSIVLYFILPMMPFIYCFFALSGWIRAIFEAIVAMPLWALAHIRIDGPGLPGTGASAGYFLILEIFLRPILIIFGLLASIQLFSALVFTMQDVFDLVVMNASGFDMNSAVNSLDPHSFDYWREPIDSFFYTAVYVVLCYIIGQSCFKLIDAVPENMMRWMGTQIKPYTEKASDTADQVDSHVYKGVTLVTGKLSGGALAALVAT